MIVALAALAGGSAWAAGGIATTGGARAPQAAAPAAGAPATNATTSTAATTGVTTTTGTAARAAASSNALSQPPASTNGNPLPPPPPTSVNPLVSSNNTVPPTPAPATAGLPSPPQSPALPSQQGLSAREAQELRPSPSLDATQVASVQASLAAGGLYRGPIDGNMSASLRASVREYQALIGLPQTGEIDGETIARLQRSALAGSVGSNASTSTVGNRGAAGDPFSTSSPPAPLSGSPATSGSGTATFSTPFHLSAPINTSPATGQTATVQP